MTFPVRPDWFAPAMESLFARRDLSPARARAAVSGILDGAAEAETAAFLTALRMKGETADELAAAAAVIRERGRIVHPGRDDCLDTCGTGGDGSNFFNVSTAVAFVAAGAGVPVVKHGNRAMSGTVGAADVLTALGVPSLSTPEDAAACLASAGMTFCFAPLYHPALKSVADVRRRLGFRTMFNCLGPLTNPARAPYQLLGVGRREWLDPMAAALAKLGTRHAWLVHGRDGLDEVSLTDVTDVRIVRDGRVHQAFLHPEAFGLEPVRHEDVRVSAVEESRDVVLGVLSGRDGPATRLVLANAAAALVVTGRAASVPDGVVTASESIASGRAMAVLERMRRFAPSP